MGRDTSSLEKDGILKAVVETLAENLSDGVVAPLFYIGIGGAPLGIMYKAVNTMDSMFKLMNFPTLCFMVVTMLIHMSSLLMKNHPVLVEVMKDTSD